MCICLHVNHILQHRLFIWPAMPLVLLLLWPANSSFAHVMMVWDQHGDTINVEHVRLSRQYLSQMLFSKFWPIG